MCYTINMDTETLKTHIKTLRDNTLTHAKQWNDATEQALSHGEYHNARMYNMNARVANAQIEAYNNVLDAII